MSSVRDEYEKQIVKDTEKIFREEFKDTCFLYYKDILSKEYSNIFQEALIYVRVQDMLKAFEIHDIEKSFFYCYQTGYIPREDFENKYLFKRKGIDHANCSPPNFKWIGIFHQQREDGRLEPLEYECFEAPCKLNMDILYQFLYLNTHLESVNAKMHYWLRVLLCGYESYHKMLFMSALNVCQTFIFSDNKFMTSEGIDVTPILEYVFINDRYFYASYSIVIALTQRPIVDEEHLGEYPVYTDSKFNKYVFEHTQYKYTHLNSDFFPIVRKNVLMLTEEKYTFADCIKKVILKSFDLNELMPIHIKFYYRKLSQRIVIIMPSVQDAITPDNIHILFRLNNRIGRCFDYGLIAEKLCYKSSKSTLKDLLTLSEFYHREDEMNDRESDWEDVSSDSTDSEPESQISGYHALLSRFSHKRIQKKVPWLSHKKVKEQFPWFSHKKIDSVFKSSTRRRKQKL